MKIKFQKLHSSAEVPKRAHETDAGFDLTAVSLGLNKEHQFLYYNTGLAIAIPAGYAGLVFPRSSISKKDLILCNSVGVIDSGYIGDIELRFRCTKPEFWNYGDIVNYKFYEVGDRIGQLVIIKLPTIEFVETDVLENTSRGVGGFGSSNVSTNAQGEAQPPAKNL